MFIQITDVNEIRNLPESTRVKVNGKIKTIGDYADLVVAGTPLLEALAHLGQSVQVEK